MFRKQNNCNLPITFCYMNKCMEVISSRWPVRRVNVSDQTFVLQNVDVMCSVKLVEKETEGFGIVVCVSMFLYIKPTSTGFTCENKLLTL